MISEGRYERPWRRGGQVRLVHHGGGRGDNGNRQTSGLLIFAIKFCFKGGKRGVEGETSAADRETRKKAKVHFQIMSNMRDGSNQVDYNEEKSGVKKKGEEGSEDEIQEVSFCFPGHIFGFAR